MDVAQEEFMRGEVINALGNCKTVLELLSFFMKVDNFILLK